MIERERLREQSQELRPDEAVGQLRHKHSYYIGQGVDCIDTP